LELFGVLLQLLAAHHVRKMHALGILRLEFELSTMEGNAAVQYMLASEQGGDMRACFGVPLEALDTACVDQLLQRAAALAGQPGQQAPQGGAGFLLHVAYRLQQVRGAWEGPGVGGLRRASCMRPCGAGLPPATCRRSLTRSAPRARVRAGRRGRGARA
jgi:hypothetical protein